MNLSQFAPCRPFVVTISSSLSVAHFKKAIKEEISNDLKAHELDLFHVSVLDEGDLTAKVKDATGGIEPLRSTRKLSTVFPSEPPEETIHIAVKLPSPLSTLMHEFTRRRQSYLDKFPSRAPSAFAQPSQLPKFPKPDRGGFRCDRPPSAASPVPITLLYPLFNELIDDCESYQPSKEDRAFALELAHAMSSIFNNEKERQAKFLEVCLKHGLSFTPSEIVGTTFTTDGDMQCNGFIYCLGEIINEAGSKGAEPVFQAGCYYTTHLKQRRDAASLGSPLPCLGVYLIGPLLGFLGLAFTDQMQLQMLAQPIRFDYHHTDVKQRRIAAHYLGSLKRVIRKLKDYYEIELPRLRNFPTRSSSAPILPCYSRYTALSDSVVHEIQYVAQAMANKLVFFGKIDDSDIYIKFVTRYSKEAHLYCATLGIAPTLRGLEALPSG
ncbi:hypothetical protein VKT23_018394 [Stygiomarasmius scandens]|uniref:Crinkler effector protein N-terminal domain-containing protein n=1 Tax=Marasmiellus scandens TaxID=2682957 RepID=A0ABR1ISK6_9AGAR